MTVGDFALIRGRSTGGDALDLASQGHRARGGVVAVVAASIALLPLIRPTGPGNSSPVDAAIFASLLVTGAWAVADRPRLRLPYVMSMVLYMAGGLLGALLGPIPGSGLLAIAQEFALLLWALAIANALRTADELGLVLKVWVWSALAWAGLMMGGYALDVEQLAGRDPEFGDRTALTFADPNMAGTYFVLAVMLVWAARTPRRLGLRLTAYAILIVALVLTGSNGSLAMLAVAIAVAGTVRIAHRHGVLAGLALSCAGALAVAALLAGTDVADLQQRAGEAGRTGELTIGRSDQSIEGRLQLKEQGIELFRDGSVLGSGPNSAEWRLARQQAPVVTELHDDYLATLVERGVIGTAGLVALIASLAGRARMLVQPRVPDAYVAVLPRPWALVGALAGLAVAALFYEIIHFRHLWALFAVVAAVSLWRTGRRP